MKESSEGSLDRLREDFIQKGLSPENIEILQKEQRRLKELWGKGFLPSIKTPEQLNGLAAMQTAMIVAQTLSRGRTNTLIIELRRQGLKTSEIANRVGLTEGAVNKRISRLNKAGIISREV